MAITDQAIGGLSDGDATAWQARPSMSLAGRVALVACLAAFSVALAFAYRYQAYQPTNIDPFVYGQCAKEVLAGKRLYVQTWQDKPPLGLMLYAVPQLFKPRSYPAMGFFLGLWLAGEGLVYVAVLRRNLAAALCCFAFITSAPLMHEDWKWLSLEHFANPFVAGLLLLAYAMLRDRSFTLVQCALIGVLTVVAFHIRQNVVLAGVVPAMVVAFSRQPWSRRVLGLGVAALAGLICWGAVLLLVLWIGDLHGYFYTVFVYSFGYAKTGRGRDLVNLWFHFAQTRLPLLLFLFAGLGLLGRYRWLVAGSLLVGMAHCMLPKREFPHYWCNLFPFVALYMGIALQRDSIRSSSLRWTIVGAVFLAGMLSAAASLYQVYQWPTYKIYKSVAETVDRIAPPGSTLLTYGPFPSCGEGVVFLSSLPPANTYWWWRFFEGPYPLLLPRSQETIFKEYLEHPPGVMAIEKQYFQNVLKTDNPSNTDRLIRMLAARYRYRTEGTSADFVILVREQSGAAATLPNIRPAPATGPATRR
ncbi:MAG: hypothetical protein ABR964_04500 [Tepidisphaeraceae bacterium]|jgi:hypothetical protein